MTEGVVNCKIVSTMIGVEDHGILTAFINLSGDGWGIGFGGYAFDEPMHDAAGEFLGRQGVAFGMEWIRRVLETLEVERWELLPGTIVRANTEGWGGRCTGIGHAYKDRWFYPFKDLAHMFSKDAKP